VPLLERYFDYNAYPSTADRGILAEKTGLTHRQIEVWVCKIFLRLNWAMSHDSCLVPKSSQSGQENRKTKGTVGGSQFSMGQC
jgi:hypothetical protein